VAGTLNMTGGGERVIMEGLKYFKTKDLEATLLLHKAMPNQVAFFDNTYAPKLCVIDNYDDKGPEESLSFWNKMVLRFRRIPKINSAIFSINPDVIIANDLHTFRVLWVSNLISFRKLPVVVTFMHGSPFQFDDDLTKYSLVFRRNFDEIRNNDPVYRNIISAKPPHIKLPKRIILEIDCFLRYLILRRSKFVFVISEKNRREIELLFGHRNVVVISAGGFSRSELLYQRGQDMKTAFGLENHCIILSICRLVSKKRVELSIQAFAKLVENNQNNNCVMVIGGTGPHESILRSLCRDLQIEEKVRFIGQVPESQLRDWYCSCDVFISTDNADYDLSVMMALPLGCKVVISTQYSLPLELDKVRRFFFIAEPSIQDLARAINQAIQTPLSPIDAIDIQELERLTWECYFDTVLTLANCAEDRHHLQI
jgi:glycosyltransferase involved in cell wall biosynthesis